MSRFIFLLFAAFISLDAAPLKEGSLSELNALIQSTEELVAKQKALKAILTDYLVVHDSYLLDMENRELLVKTAKLAKRALDLIKQERLTPLFNPDFLSEMTLFAKVVAKPTLPQDP